MFKLSTREKLAYVIGAGKASNVIKKFHEDNLCNRGRGSDGCYCIELSEKIDAIWKGGALSV